MNDLITTFAITKQREKVILPLSKFLSAMPLLLSDIVTDKI